MRLLLLLRLLLPLPSRVEYLELAPEVLPRDLLSALVGSLEDLEDVDSNLDEVAEEADVDEDLPHAQGTSKQVVQSCLPFFLLFLPLQEQGESKQAVQRVAGGAVLDDGGAWSSLSICAMRFCTPRVTDACASAT